MIQVALFHQFRDGANTSINVVYNVHGLKGQKPHANLNGEEKSFDKNPTSF